MSYMKVYNPVMSDRDNPPVINRQVWWLVIANIAGVAGLFLYATITASMLPGRYPVHFNAAGQPDRWAQAGSGEWYVVPGFGAFMALVMVALAFGLPKIPLRLWNMPGKQKLLSLSRERQVPVIRSTVVFVLVLSLLDSALFFEIQRTMFAAANDPQLPGSFLPRLIIFSVVYLGYIVWWIVRVKRMVQKA